MKEHLFDKRVVQRALQEGLLKQDDYQRMLDALPDLSDRLQTASDIEASRSARSDHSDVDDHDDDLDHLDDDEDDTDNDTDDDEEEDHEDGDAPTPNAFSSDV